MQDVRKRSDPESSAQHGHLESQSLTWLTSPWGDKGFLSNTPPMCKGPRWGLASAPACFAEEHSDDCAAKCAPSDQLHLPP